MLREEEKREESISNQANESSRALVQFRVFQFLES